MVVVSSVFEQPGTLAFVSQPGASLGDETSVSVPYSDLDPSMVQIDSSGVLPHLSGVSDPILKVSFLQAIQ